MLIKIDTSTNEVIILDNETKLGELVEFLKRADPDAWHIYSIKHEVQSVTINPINVPINIPTIKPWSPWQPWEIQPYIYDWPNTSIRPMVTYNNIEYSKDTVMFSKKEEYQNPTWSFINN